MNKFSLKEAFYVLLGVILIGIAIMWGMFYWTTCAFTPIAEAPVICIWR